MDVDNNICKSENVDKGPILHVVVIGFHHKKGCQVEYAYPPFHDGDSVENTECPDEWKHLPTLALPDGAHNFEKDTIYFHMPSRNESSKTVFGISCYRQINAENLINKSADITRGTVQKSVCILSMLPLYGLINAKLELITHAYFDERDFTKVTLLEETFKSLNSSLRNDLAQGQQIYIGLSARDLILQFKHKIVLLIKLILLEKKIVFLKAPVKSLCTCILSLLSLFPGMLEHGLTNCMELADIKNSVDIISDSVNVAQQTERGNDNEIKNALDASVPESSIKDVVGDVIELGRNKMTSLLNQRIENDIQCNHRESKNDILETNYDEIDMDADSKSVVGQRKPGDDDKLSELEELLDSEVKEKVDLTKLKLEFQDKDSDAMDGDLSERERNSLKGSKTSLESKESSISHESVSRVVSLKGRVMGAFSYWTSKDKSSEMMETVVTPDNDLLENDSEKVSVVMSDYVTLKEIEDEQPPLPDVINLDINKCGLPLHIFEEGMLCHPYLSLPFLDLLKDPSVRGFLAGATNVLFKQKRNLVDAIVEIDDSKIEIWDNDLRKQLHLTTEDLRFADYLVKNVSEDQQDVFLDGTGQPTCWEGGDEWIRGQFKLYILCLLRTSMLQEGSRETETFNPLFMYAWQQTHNYTVWRLSDHSSLLEINPGHPFQGQLSMADMRLRISHTMQNSERGRKLNQAVVNTGKAVVQTSRALGGALTQARSTVSSWLQMFSNTSLQSQPTE